MSERKVLNKYYPPDFDPSKIPRTKGSKNREFSVRLMAPCNMKCLTCGEYIAKAKKFNARKEDVENKTYLGIRIYRFYIKCPGCLAEISFRTDPESTDYILEAGAHRNFQALRLAEEKAQREEREAKEEIESNPMLLLENRTQQSQREMEVLESLEDLRELNQRHAGINLESMTRKYDEQRNLTKEQEEELEKLAALKALGYEEVEGKLIKRISQETDQDKPNKKAKSDFSSLSASDHLITCNDSGTTKNKLKGKLVGLVKFSKKQNNTPNDKTTSEIQPKSLNSKEVFNSDQAAPATTSLPIQNASTANASPGKSTSALSLLGSYSDSSPSNSDGEN